MEICGQDVFANMTEIGYYTNFISPTLFVNTSIHAHAYVHSNTAYTAYTTPLHAHTRVCVRPLYSWGGIIDTGASCLTLPEQMYDVVFFIAHLILLRLGGLGVSRSRSC